VRCEWWCYCDWWIGERERLVVKWWQMAMGGGQDGVRKGLILPAESARSVISQLHTVRLRIGSIKPSSTLLTTTGKEEYSLSKSQPRAMSSASGERVESLLSCICREYGPVHRTDGVVPSLTAGSRQAGSDIATR
jgi:hypothetical protein